MGKVLIVEDNATVCEGLKEIVLRIDNSLEVFCTGYAKEALAYAKKEAIDLFLFDIELMDYSGVTLAKEIRELESYRLTPMVFITSILTKELIAFREIHCYDYISKPFKLEKVRETLMPLIKEGIRAVKEEPKLTLKQKACHIAILEKDIIYIESKVKKLCITTIHEEFIIASYTLNFMEELLTSDFIRCHKGFMVNKKFIHTIDRAKQKINLISYEGTIPFGDHYKERLIGEGL